MTAAGDIQCAYHGEQLLHQTAAKQAQRARTVRLNNAVGMAAASWGAAAEMWLPKVWLWLSFAVHRNCCGG